MRKIYYNLCERHPILWLKSMFVNHDVEKIPKGLYCYDDNICPYMQIHKRFSWYKKGLVTFNYCSYCRASDMVLLDDYCKICRENEDYLG